MSQEYTVAWVGDKTRPWQGQKGSFIDYQIALEGRDGTLKLTQVPDTPAPQKGQSLYGSILTETKTNHQTGEDFELVKFKKEQRPDASHGPTDRPRSSVDERREQMGVRRPDSRPQWGDDKPSAEFWAQKDKRIARAGIVQAVVASGRFNGEPQSDIYLREVNRLSDALLASLDEVAPHPGDNPSPVAGEATSGNGGQGRPVAQPPEPATVLDYTGDGDPATAAVGPDDSEDIPF